jgi:hypothetical protein
MAPCNCWPISLQRALHDAPPMTQNFAQLG